MKILALSFAALAASSAGALAGDLAIASRVTAVTVHPQGAAVQREASFAVPAGVSVLVASDLPTDMATDSLRVEGLAAGGVTIRSVETRPEPADPEADPVRNAIADEIETLEDRVGGLDDRLAALDLRLKFIDGLAENLPQGFAKNFAEGKGVDNWAQTGEGLAAEREKIDALRTAVRMDKRGLEKQIVGRRKALDMLPPVLPKLSARIEVTAAEAATGKLTLGYRTQSAGWSPAYDVSLVLGEAGAEPKLELVRRAELHQETGEDWSGVALSLSTLRPAEGTQAPEPYESVVRFVPRYDAKVARESLAVARPAPAPPITADAAAGGYGAMANSEAVADFGDFRAEYRIPDPVSVASGQGSRSVRIATESLKPTLEVRAVPAVSDAAYLTARFKNSSGAPYVGGEAVLYRDGAFAGTVPLDFTAPDGEVALGFGIDDKVAVTRTKLQQKTGERGLISTEKTDERRYQIKVENRHDRPMTIVVLDQLPVAEAKTIAVEPLAGATPPTEMAVAGRRGVVAWRYDYAAGETREIVHAFAISWPSDQDVFWEN
ncbi:hypothetical protein K32_35390 [Kaistia sp. 32K]|uniref:mucoidy inhibitor MuiA family protein n=1 Tax=Kaistia sp. 32K TaxID=2795690 RepID=UPI0019167906|nr:mucoidy inhibitor MuiA family protein [Kaistia sp. 32K]BCP54922.1 hypothetical protein K32_35390 [Kaistia sp. 32K]